MKFVVYDRDPVDKWSFGRVTLLGDAAHPMLPFGSQGAGQAILDAASLGQAIEAEVETQAATVGSRQGAGGRAGGVGDAATAWVPAALRRYEEERLPKANKVVLATRKGGDHLPLDLVCSRHEGCKPSEISQSVLREEICQARREYIKTAGYAVAKKKE